MKYKKGEFGYWWTVENGNKDIEGKVCVGSIYCYHSSLTSLKGAPKEVSGYFDCSCNKLTTLKGAPEKVGGNFDCSYNQLTTLEDAPKSVGGSYYCNDNALTTLKGAPKEVGGNFDCSYNQLTTLEAAPKSVVGYFDCGHNKLTSLKGAPEKVGGSFYCSSNALTTLKGAPEKVGDNFDCSYNKLTSLEGAPKSVVGYFDCGHNKLTSLKGTPKEVGGYFDCGHNKLTSLKGFPQKTGISINVRHNLLASVKELIGTGRIRYLHLIGNPDLEVLPEELDCNGIFILGDTYRWRGSTWSFFDGTHKEVATIRKSGSLTVYKMKDGTYAVHDGEAYAHGKTLKEAKADLIYKRTSRDLSEYKELTMDSKLSLEECIKMYRSITGACSLGTKEFCSKRKLKKAYTVREVIEITDGAYGNERLKEFFGKEANVYNR